MNQATLMPGESGDSFTRNVAHRGPAFGPWHREMLRRFELDLQAKVPGVTLPYWDWAADVPLADPTHAPVWGADLMGGDGDPGNSGFVATGAFKYDPSDPNTWTIVTDPGDPGPGLRRTLGQGAPSLPSQSDIDTVNQVTPYDSAPWRMVSNPSFRNQLEGWAGPNLHNRVHVWVGGSMLPGTSPNDPVFFLHHCNVDRLWWDWQRSHPTEGYVPTANGPPGHDLDDQMTPWDAATTPRSTLDIHQLGYRYDTDPPLQISFLIDQSTFSQDEVELQLPGTATFAAGWIAVDGFTPSDLGLNAGNLANPPAASIPVLATSLDPALTAPEALAIQGMLAAPVVTGPVVPEDPSLPNLPQRFLFPFQVSFTNDAGFLAMAAATPPVESTVVTLSASLNAAAGAFAAQSQIELTTGEDPRFVDVNPQNPTQFPSWLSFDLRFFKMAVPPNGSAQRFGATITDAADAPAFVAQVIQNLTDNGGGMGTDSFDTGLSQDEDASKLEFQQQDNAGNNVFNFAVARVRLRAESAATAQRVRVFFRLFQAQSTSSSFDEGTTYRFATDGTTFGHKIPRLGVQNHNGQPEYVTIPCFASPRQILVDQTQSMDAQQDPPNARDLATAPGAEKDYFFGCWIDNNQPGQLIMPASPPAGNFDGPWPGIQLHSMRDAMTAFPHQCLIAEIRYDDTPIPPGADSSTSDKLAQRNIAWVDGPNPGAPASRRVVHPVQIRPTPKGASDPDQLMILWGDTPIGSTATLFLPAMDAAAIVQLADQGSGAGRLQVIDGHTIGCRAEGATFVPLPYGLGLAAGLLAIDLPTGVRRGDRYTVDVRQVTGMSGVVRSVGQFVEGAETTASRRGHRTEISWRRVDGAFRFAITISTKDHLLVSEERLLAVLRWMHARTPHVKRWFPVLTRYIDDVAGRVRELGGDPGSIRPSATGSVPRLHRPPGHGADGREGAIVTGKVHAIMYDHFGDFSGFVVESEAGHLSEFESREGPMLHVVKQAWADRTRVRVMSEPGRPEVPRTLVILATP